MPETPKATTLHSSEVRWFWPGACPESVRAWFEGGEVPPGGGGLREDSYLLDPGQMALGIKLRGGKPGCEVKGLLESDSGLALPAPFDVPVERWCKWTSAALDLGGLPTVTVTKWRRLRKLDLDDEARVREVALGTDEQPLTGPGLTTNGCNIELTEVSLPAWPAAGLWWTLGLEAFGPPSRVEANLLRAVVFLAQRGLPNLGGGLVASYPRWLDQVHADPAAPAGGSATGPGLVPKP